MKNKIVSLLRKFKLLFYAVVISLPSSTLFMQPTCVYFYLPTKLTWCKSSLINQLYEKFYFYVQQLEHQLDFYFQIWFLLGFVLIVYGFITQLNLVLNPDYQPSSTLKRVLSRFIGSLAFGHAFILLQQSYRSFFNQTQSKMELLLNLRGVKVYRTPTDSEKVDLFKDELYRNLSQHQELLPDWLSFQELVVNSKVSLCRGPLEVKELAKQVSHQLINSPLTTVQEVTWFSSSCDWVYNHPYLTCLVLLGTLTLSVGGYFLWVKLDQLSQTQSVQKDELENFKTKETEFLENLTTETKKKFTDSLEESNQSLTKFSDEIKQGFDSLKTNVGQIQLELDKLSNQTNKSLTDLSNVEQTLGQLVDKTDQKLKDLIFKTNEELKNLSTDNQKSLTFLTESMSSTQKDLTNLNSLLSLTNARVESLDSETKDRIEQYKQLLDKSISDLSHNLNTKYDDLENFLIEDTTDITKTSEQKMLTLIKTQDQKMQTRLIKLEDKVSQSQPPSLSSTELASQVYKLVKEELWEELTELIKQNNTNLVQEVKTSNQKLELRVGNVERGLRPPIKQTTLTGLQLMNLKKEASLKKSTLTNKDELGGE